MLLRLIDPDVLEFVVDFLAPALELFFVPVKYVIGVGTIDSSELSIMAR